MGVTIFIRNIAPVKKDNYYIIKNSGDMKSTIIFITASAFLAFSLSSCVSKKVSAGLHGAYASLQKAYNTLQEKYQSTQIDLAKAQRRTKAKCRIETTVCRTPEIIRQQP